MNVLIMGCGRVARIVAETLASESHTVIVMDIEEENFRYLPESLGIIPMIGDGVSDKDLKRAGVEDADVFVAADPSDARNALAAQKARYVFNTPKVVCHMDDSLRQQVYSELGLLTVGPSQVVSDLILDAIHNSKNNRQ